MDGNQLLNSVRSEIHNVLSTMRRQGLWAQEERFTRELLTDYEDALIRSFKCLQEYLQTYQDITSVDTVVLLQPFLDVIWVANTDGDMTCKALSSINKFLLYGAISQESPRSRLAINIAVRSVVECNFEAFHSVSVEVVLIQLLEVMENLLRCPAGCYISDENVWKLIETSYRLKQGSGTSQILKSTAANTVTHLVLTLFSRSSELITPEAILEYENSEPAPMEAESHKHGEKESSTEKEPGDNYFISEVVRDLIPQADREMDSTQAIFHMKMGSAGLAATVLRSATNNARFGSVTPRPYGLPILVQILEFVASLTDPARNSEPTRIFALQLINIILETGGEILATSPEGGSSPIIAILHGNLCKYLLQNSQSIDLSILSLTLRVIFNLFNAMKGHLKVQLEVFLTSVHLRIVQSSSCSFEQKELALESLLDFCREPALVLDLYTNYDCDFRCTNLFETLVKCLCRCSVPMSLSRDGLEEDGDEAFNANIEAKRNMAYEYEGSSITVLEVLALEGVLIVVDSIARRCVLGSAGSATSDLVDKETETPPRAASPAPESDSDDSDAKVGTGKKDLKMQTLSHDSRANLLRERKKQKRRLMLVSQQFNKAPTKNVWQEYAQDLGILPKNLTAKDVASFFLKTPGLDKTAVGEYISEDPERKPFNNQVLLAYVKSFHFRGVRIDKALRMLLECFRLPGEAQKVDRVMDNFGKEYYEQNLSNDDPIDENSDAIGVFKSGDAAFIFAFSIIMLHTDLHNQNILPDRKMTCAQFVNNNRSINEGSNIPQHLQEAVYESIKGEEMRMLYDPHVNNLVESEEAKSTPAKTITNGVATWDHVLRHSRIVDKASFTPSSVGYSALRAGVQERDMFIIVFDKAVQSILFVLEMTSDGKIASRALEGFRNLAKIAVYFQMYDRFNQIMILLCQYFGRIFNAVADAGQNDHDHEGLAALRDALLLSENVRTSTESTRKLVTVLAKTERFAALPSCRALITFQVILSLIKLHGSCVREGWRNFVKALLELHTVDLLPSSFVEVDDVVDSHGNRLPTVATSVGLPQYRDRPAQSPSRASPKGGGGFFSSLTSLLWAPDEEEDQLYAECKQMVREILVTYRLNTIFSKSKVIHENSLILLIDAVLVPLENAEYGRDPGAFENNSVLCVELITELGLVNHERFELVWQFMRRAYKQVLINAKALPECDDEALDVSIDRQSENGSGLFAQISTSPLTSPRAPLLDTPKLSRSRSSSFSVKDTDLVYFPSRPSRLKQAGRCSIFVVERVVVSLLRVCVNLLHKSSLAPNLIKSLGWFAEFSDPLCASLAARIGSGLSTILKIHGACIDRVEDWCIMTTLISKYSAIPAAEDFMWDSITSIVANVNPQNLTLLLNLLSDTIKQGNKHSVSAVNLLLDIANQVMSDAPESKFIAQREGRTLSERRSSSTTEVMESSDGHNSLSPLRKSSRGNLVVESAISPPERFDSWMMIILQIRGWFSDPRPAISQAAMRCLQSALWSPPSSVHNWSHIFDKVLFPLMDPQALRLERDRISTTNLLVRTFLHNLNSLKMDPSFHLLWLRVITALTKRYAKSEAAMDDCIFENIKNLVMVVQGEDILNAEVWELTWTAIDTNATGLREAIMQALDAIQPQTPDVSNRKNLS